MNMPRRTSNPSAEPRRLGWSALFDGECRADELDRLLGHEDAAARDAAWDLYRCIGDALRAHEAAQPSAADPDFVRAVMARVAKEPQVSPEPAARLQRRTALPSAANAALWRWRALAGVAALAAVVAVLWPVLGPTGGVPGEPVTLAGAPAPAAPPTAAEAEPAARDAQLDDLVAAHRAWGSASALQAPGGFLRTVAYDTPGR